MRRILINEKNEFSVFGVKISKSNEGVKMLGSLFESNDNRKDRDTSVIISNKAEPTSKKVNNR